MSGDNNKYVTGNLLKGKSGLIMGVANHNSIAWGIAQALNAQGAKLAFSYQGEAFGKRLKPLAEKIDCDFLIDCDVYDEKSMDSLFSELKEKFGKLDFIIHAIGYSDKDELKGLYANTSRDNFVKTMVISCFSFTEIAKRSVELMPDGGSLVTLSYEGSTKVMPNYNVMGLAKAALEASVRYLADDYGERNIRVNAISPGPMRTLAGAGIAGARSMLNFQKTHSLLRRSVTLEDVGGCATYLVSDLSSGITGGVHFVDAGFNTVSTPHPDRL